MSEASNITTTFINIVGQGIQEKKYIMISTELLKTFFINTKEKVKCIIKIQF